MLRGQLVQGIVLDRAIPAASALKMAYAAWNKGAVALLLAVRALAAEHGVAQALLDEWKLSMPDLPERSERAARGSAPRAWRWVGEMHEIARAFAGAGLPAGFHDASAAIYERLSRYKDAPMAPDAEAVVAALSERPRA
jgi:hypothetical protein